MSKFKIRDLVQRINRNEYKIKIGDIHIVKYVNSSLSIISLNHTNFYYAESNFKKVNNIQSIEALL